MLDRGTGRVINVSSIVGETGNSGQADYAAAKSGLLGLTKALAKEAAFLLGKAGGGQLPLHRPRLGAGHRHLPTGA